MGFVPTSTCHYRKHGDAGDCTLCDSNIEFYNRTSVTYAENIGAITCYKHQAGCNRGYGFKIGSSHS